MPPSEEEQRAAAPGEASERSDTAIDSVETSAASAAAPNGAAAPGSPPAPATFWWRLPGTDLAAQASSRRSAASSWLRRRGVWPDHTHLERLWPRLQPHSDEFCRRTCPLVVSEDARLKRHSHVHDGVRESPGRLVRLLPVPHLNRQRRDLTMGLVVRTGPPIQRALAVRIAAAAQSASRKQR